LRQPFAVVDIRAFSSSTAISADRSVVIRRLQVRIVDLDAKSLFLLLGASKFDTLADLPGKSLHCALQDSNFDVFTGE